MYETAYQNPQNYTQLQETQNTVARCPFRSMLGQIWERREDFRCWYPLSLLTHSASPPASAKQMTL